MFFLAAYDYLTNPEHYKLDRKQREYLKYKTFHGWEIVPNTFRLCLMNLFLYNIGDLDGKVTVIRNDALLSAPKETFDYVLTNPPFGKKQHDFYQ